MASRNMEWKSKRDQFAGQVTEAISKGMIDDGNRDALALKGALRTLDEALSTADLKAEFSGFKNVNEAVTFLNDRLSGRQGAGDHYNGLLIDYIMSNEVNAETKSMIQTVLTKGTVAQKKELCEKLEIA